MELPNRPGQGFEKNVKINEDEPVVKLVCWDEDDQVDPAKRTRTIQEYIYLLVLLAGLFREAP